MTEERVSSERFADSENNVCPTCMGANLLEEIKIARCATCNKIYCVHFASAIDPAHCVSCLSEITMTRETVVKEYKVENYDEENDVIHTHSYRRRAEQIKMEGQNWLFAQRKIATLSDDELELGVEYHRSILNGMLGEREARRVAKAHRFAGVQLPASSTTSTNETITTTKTKKSVKSTKQAATAKGLLESLQASGMDISQILNLLQGVTK